MSSKRVAVLEFVCGSGMFRDADPNGNRADGLSPSTGLWSEGLEMLLALSGDLHRQGIEVQTLVDPSIREIAVQRAPWFADIALPSKPHDGDRLAWLTEWTELGSQCDCAIVIAPELDHTLGMILDHLRLNGIRVVAADWPFLAIANDKLATANRFRQHSLLHPPTWPLSTFVKLSSKEPLEDLPNDGHGWVLKRRFGAGSVDLQRFTSVQAVVQENSIRVRDTWLDDDWIVQSWVDGRAASTALLAGEHGFQCLGAFEQQFDPNTNGYLGGAGPIDGLADRSVESMVGRVLEALLPGKPLGWIGIDFVIADTGELIPIEVNARLTTSYLGYRQWYGKSLAAAMVSGTLCHNVGLDPHKPRVSFGLT